MNCTPEEFDKIIKDLNSAKSAEERNQKLADLLGDSDPSLIEEFEKDIRDIIAGHVYSKDPFAQKKLKELCDKYKLNEK